MAMAHERSEWDRAAFIVAKIHNVNCAKRSDMITDLTVLNPYRVKQEKRISLKEFRRVMENGS